MPTTKKSSKDTPIPKPKIINAARQAKVHSNKVAGVGKNQLRGFLDFIRTQGVVGLAVGLVLGGAVSVLVKSLIDNVVMPPIGLLLGSAEGLKGLVWTIGTTADGKSAVLHYGVFLNDTINFIVIALVIYLIIHLLKFDRIDKKKG
ncbi:MscL family protein [Candidatus Saccharibacteria bacterium]|nr:MscL family protein [Candidatus Saccharibacteria bacterium]